jgi:hypothetical protein
MWVPVGPVIKCARVRRFYQLGFDYDSKKDAGKFCALMNTLSFEEYID